MKLNVKLKIILILILFGIYSLSFNFIFTNSIYAISQNNDDVYSSYTNENSVHENTLNKYKTTIYGGSKTNTHTSIVNNKPVIKLDSIYNNATESIKTSNLDKMKPAETPSHDAYTLKKLIQQQTQIPTTQTNPEKFFPAYNQQHQKSNGVQFSEIVTEINNKDFNSSSNIPSYKTFSTIDNPDNADKVSFENISRRIKNEGVINKKMIDKIDGIYFEPNKSTAHKNKLKKPAQDNTADVKTYDQDYDTVQIFGSM
jgi:hypothetical protein